MIWFESKSEQLRRAERNNCGLSPFHLSAGISFISKAELFSLTLKGDFCSAWAGTSPLLAFTECFCSAWKCTLRLVKEVRWSPDFFLPDRRLLFCDIHCFLYNQGNYVFLAPVWVMHEWSGPGNRVVSLAALLDTCWTRARNCNHMQPPAIIIPHIKAIGYLL